MKLLTVVVGVLFAFAVQAANVTVSAASGETTTDELRTGSINLFVNTNKNNKGTVILNGANDYEGTTTLRYGTLEAPVLAETGEASSLGKSGNFIFRGGTFCYTGSDAATFGHDITQLGRYAACIISNGVDLTLAETCKRYNTSGDSLTKIGAGTLSLTASGNLLNTVYVNAGTLALTDGTTSLGGPLYVNAGMLALTGGTTSLDDPLYVCGPIANASVNNKSTLRITGGTHSLTNLYVGQNNKCGIQHSDEYWADFIMTGGSVTADQISLGNMGKAHVTMDVSGGTLTDSGTFNAAYNSSDDYDKYYDITIRDTAVVSANVFYTGRYKKTHLMLTVKDGGTFRVGAIYQYGGAGSAYAYTVLFDGGNVVWSGKYEDVFRGAQSLLYSPILIGTNGATFTGISRQQPYTYGTAMTATNTVENGTAAGVSFATGTYALMVANTYDGPTEIKSDATVIAGVTTAIPSDSVVTVDAGGILAVTNLYTAVGGLNLNGDLDICTNASLSVGSSTIAGSGRVVLCDDAARTVLTTTPGSYKILSTAVANAGVLQTLAGTLQNGNGGSFEVKSINDKSYLKLTIPNVVSIQPDCGIEGTNGEGTVTFSCSGTVVLKDGVKCLQPGSAATLSASGTVGGMYLAGWRDETTQDFYWGNDVAVTPTTYTTYTAVYGPAWFYENKQISNGIWQFGAYVSSGTTAITVTNLTSVTTVDGVLNFATPITNADGTASSYTITQLGTPTKSQGPFSKATADQNKALKRLYLPATLTRLGDSVFEYCSNLTGRVTTPAACTRIDRYSFRYCTRLTSLDLPNVTVIEENVFIGCTGLTSLNLTNVTTIGESAFNGCTGLTSLDLPSVTTIGVSAFKGCTGLTSLNLPNVTTIGKEVFYGCTGLTSLNLPSVTTIGESAFEGCSGLISVNLSNDLTTVGRTAFAYSYNLERVTPFLPDGLRSVGRSAFFRCYKLTGDLSMKSVLNIDYQGFSECTALATSVYMPSVTNVGYRAFYKVPATNYVFGTGRVYFNDLTTEGKVNGHSMFYLESDIVRHFWFPGQAPDMPERVISEVNMGTTGYQLFGTDAQSGKVILHGSWRLDPEGWGKILTDVGSTDMTGKTLPTLLRKDREVKGWFKWRNPDVSDTSMSWGWLMDTRMFGDHGTGIGYK